MKQFTTASVASLAGAALIAVACSSSETTGSGGTGDGGTSSSGGTLVEGGTGSGGKCTGEGSITVAASPSGGGDGGADGGAACPKEVSISSADLDQAIGWKCPARKKGACTAAEIASIETNLGDANVKSYYDITKDTSEACQACAVSKETDSAWAPIVGFTQTGGETGLLNYGACFGYLIGATCGRSVQYLELCLGQACDECSTDQATAKACVEAASAGGCKGFVDSVAKECPLLANAQSQCSDIIEAIKTVCGP